MAACPLREPGDVDIQLQSAQRENCPTSEPSKSWSALVSIVYSQLLPNSNTYLSNYAFAKLPAHVVHPLPKQASLCWR